MRSPPPAGPPWDLPLAQTPFAFVDLEMTGLDSEKDRVIELCVERVVGGKVVGSVAGLVRPEGTAIGAAHVHGIGASDLEGAPAFAELAPRIQETLGGAIFVAHAAEWDAVFLKAEMKRCGAAFELEHWLDTLALSRRAFALPSHSLGALAEAFGIPRGRAHRAPDDVAVLRAVFDRCVDTLAPTSARDLWEVRVAARQARQHILEQCERAIQARAPVEVSYRPARRGAQELTMVLTELRSDLDPPRVIGYLLPSRGRRELRTDRILRVEPVGVPSSST